VPRAQSAVGDLPRARGSFTDASQIDWCNAVTSVLASSADVTASSAANAAASVQLAYDMNQFFLIIMGALVMFMCVLASGRRAYARTT